MGEMGDLVTKYLTKRGENTGNWSSEYNHKDFINWLCGDGEHEYQEYQTACTVSTELQEEFNLITNPLMRTWIDECIFYSPANYWIKPSGFYDGHHPKDEHSEWGNLIHVKRTIKIAAILADIENLSNHEHNILIAALLIHDIGKYGLDGKNPKIIKEHPLIVREMISNFHLTTNLDKTIVDDILSLVETHMGRWHNPRPSTLLQWVCHYADCIASQPDLVIPVSLGINKACR